MTVEAADIAVCAGSHGVAFYETDSELFDTVGSYLTDAIGSGAVAIVIATEAHQRGFEAQLGVAGIDPAQARRSGTIVSLDAAATLALFMSHGRVDRDAFHQVIGSVVREAADAGRPVCAYGEMVALLWDAGDVLAAIELETLWNELRRELEFSLLCTYHSESVSGSEHTDALQHVCQLHSSVESSAKFPPEPDAPRAARRFVAEALAQWGHDETLVDDAELVLSELATNAVVHAQSPFVVVARSARGAVRLSVRDVSSVQPTPRDPAGMTPSGRGLLVVAALASDWGVELTGSGKTVWAELHR